MKKFWFILLAATAVFCSSCQTGENFENGEGVSSVVFKAVAYDQLELKATLGNESPTKFLWQTGDAIRLFVGTADSKSNYKGTLVDGFNSSLGSFGNVNEKIVGTTFNFSVFPYAQSEGTTNPYLSYASGLDNYVSGALFTPMIAVPEEQFVVENGESYDNLFFCHVGGALKFTLKGVPAGVNSVVFSAAEDICGKFYIDSDGLSAASVKDGTWKKGDAASPGSVLTFSFPALGETQDMVFYVPVPAGVQLTTMMIIDVKADDTVVRSFEKISKEGASYTVKRAVVANLGEFVFTEETPETARFVLAKDVSVLSAGTQIIIAHGGSSKAMGAQSGTMRCAADVTIANETIEVDTDGAVQKITMETGSQAGSFAFNVGDGYLWWNPKTTNAIGTSPALNEESSWTITIDDAGDAIISNVDTPARMLQYNVSDPRFVCYVSSSKQKPVQIYYKSSSGTIVPTPLTPLAAPTGLDGISDGNSVYLEWNPVTNAAAYAVYMNGSVSEAEIDMSGSKVSATISGLEYAIEYSFTVVAKAEAGSQKYSDSAQSPAISITTEDDPAGGEVTETWTLVTDASVLNAGSRLIVAAKDYAYAMSTTQDTNNRRQASITKSGNTVTFESDVEILTLATGFKSGTYALKAAGGYLYAASSDKNYLRTQSDIDDNASWTISVSSDGTAAVKAQGANTRNTLRYNESSKLFSCYSSGQKDIVLYKSNKNSSESGGEVTPPETTLTTTISGVTVGSIGTTEAFVSCSGIDLNLVTLTFYAKEGGSTISASPAVHNENYANATFTGLKPSTTYTYYVEGVASDGQKVKSAEGTFTTREGSVEATYGWLELPAKGDVSTAKEYVFRSGERNYTAYYDTDTYSSLWIAYPLAKGHSGSLDRPKKWYFAPGIDESLQVDLTSHSYNDSYSRGHQIPNGDRNGNSGMQTQTFYVINSVPQIQNGFNGGIWNSLENAIRSEVPSKDTLYIATGPVYQTVGGSESLKYTSAKDDNKRLPVPNYFFKVVLKVKRSGNTISDAKAVGFWFDHKVYSGNSYTACEVSVDFIEQKTGYNFFANLPDDIEAKAEQNDSWSTFTAF